MDAGECMENATSASNGGQSLVDFLGEPTATTHTEDANPMGAEGGAPSPSRVAMARRGHRPSVTDFLEQTEEEVADMLEQVQEEPPTPPRVGLATLTPVVPAVASSAGLSVRGGEAEAAIWFVQEATLAWRPLSVKDQERLEAAVQTADSASVAVEGGRSEVRLRDRLLVDRYAASPPPPPREVRRCLWLCCVAEESWEPLSESVDLVVEETYRFLLRKAKAATAPGAPKLESGVVLEQSTPTLEGDMEIALTLTLASAEYSSRKLVWELSAQERSTVSSWWSPLTGTPYRELKRGCKDVSLPTIDGEAEEAALGDEVRRLFIFVHGLDQQFEDDREPDVGALVSSLRGSLQRYQLRSTGFTQRKDKTWAPRKSLNMRVPPPAKDEVLEASWWHSVSSGKTPRHLTDVSLVADREIRDVTHRAIAETFFYMQARTDSGIRNAVLEAVESILGRFKRHHPNFRGDICLVGHSVGGSILFELLRSRSLSFCPKALFTLGSPIGMFLHCIGAAPLCEGVFPDMVQFFNVFHPSDPLAYRTEPLLVPLSLGVSIRPPKPLALAQGGKSAQRSERSTRILAQRDGESPSPNGGQRIDWILDAVISTEDDPGKKPEAHVYIDHPAVVCFISSITDQEQDPDAWPVLASVDDSEETESDGSVLDSFGENIFSSARSSALSLSRIWGDSGVSDVVSSTAEVTGATDVMMGTVAAANGLVGIARGWTGTLNSGQSQ